MDDIGAPVADDMGAPAVVTGGAAGTLLDGARAARRRRDFVEHSRLVDELEALAAAGEDDDVLLAVAAERLRDVGFSSRTRDEFRTIRDELTAMLDRASDPSVRARLLVGRGQAHARLLEPGWGVAAARDLRAAARAFAQADEFDDASSAMTTLAWSVELLTVGLRAAQRSLDEAIDLARLPSHAATALTQRAKVRLWLGDVDGAAADTDVAARYEGDLDHTTIAYQSWAEMLVHAARGDVDRVRTAHARGEANLTDWHDTATGIQYDAEVAEALAQAGLDKLAWTTLARAQTRRDDDPDAVRRAELVVHALIGDTDEAVAAWADVARQPTHEPWERARLRLLTAYAMHRAGSDATSMAAQAYDEMAARARPDTVLHREPIAASVLLPVAREGGSRTAAWLHRRRHGWYLDLLDRVALVGPDGQTEPITSRIATLLAVLVDADGPVPPERVADQVWPDRDDLKDPVARVRRLLHRVRGIAPVAERDSNGHLLLGDDVTGDVQELDMVIARCRAADGAAARESWLEEAAQIAARVDTGRLMTRTDLPEALRDRLQRRLHWLHRELGWHRADARRDDLARQHWRTALALVPEDDTVAMALARSLVAEGRRADALDVVRATHAALGGLGLRPSAPFEAFTATLSTDAP